MESGGDESGCDKSLGSVVGVSGWGGSWTEDFSETEGRVGDVASVLGTAVVSVASTISSLARDGTLLGVGYFFMYGRK